MIASIKFFLESIEGVSLTDDKFLLAISGGRDSVALAHAFKSIGVNFGLAHVNYQLRDQESEEDAQFVNSLAQSLGVEIHLHTQPISDGLNVQVEARKIRYDFFQSVLDGFGYNHLVIAHHQDDNIETVLLNFTRGTGIQGISGMKVKGNILRPLLNTSRKEITEYLTTNSLNYREDSSNSDLKYKRNKLRHDVIPRLLDLEEDTRSKMLSSISNLESDAMAIEEMASTLSRRELDVIVVDLGSLPQESKSTWLYYVAKKFGFNRNQCLDLCASQDSGSKVLSSSHAIYLHKNDAHIVPIERVPLKPLKVSAPGRYENHSIILEILKGDRSLAPSHSTGSATMSVSATTFPLELSVANKSDHFRPFGMDYNVKLFDYLKDKGFPAYQRSMTPVLRDSVGEICWIPGVQISDHVKLTDDESTSLIVSFAYL